MDAKKQRLLLSILDRMNRQSPIVSDVFNGWNDYVFKDTLPEAEGTGNAKAGLRRIVEDLILYLGQ